MPGDIDRLQSIAVAIVDALQEVVDKHEITQDELHATGDFLDRIGQARMGKSLLDIFFAMTVVDREQQGRPGTRPNLAGPYYRGGAPERRDGSLLERPLSPDASLLTLAGVVTNARTGAPISGAELDFWHADELGGYDHEGFHLRGLVRTDDRGRYVVHTVLPTDYAEHKNDPIGELLVMIGRHTYRAAHIHLKVRVDGEEWLMTQLFRSDSPYLDSDYVRGAVAGDLVVDLKEVEPVDGHAAYESVFDLAIAPPEERAS
jgi:catechol 1,2-dioxygenase